MDINYRELPFIGGYISKIGRVYDIVMADCQPDPEMWVYAFWHGVPMIFYSLLIPDWEDELTNRFGRTHSKRRRGRFRAQGRLEPINIPGRGPGWAIFRLNQLLDRIGWWLLVVDVGLDFAINWTSTAYRWSGCRTPGAPYVSTSWGSNVYYPAGDWRVVSTVLQSRNILTYEDPWIGAPPGYTMSVMSSAEEGEDTFGNYTSPIMSARIRERGTNRIVAMAEPNTGADGKTSVSLRYNDYFQSSAGKQYVFEIRPGEDSRGTTLRKATFSGIGAKDPTLFPWTGFQV